MSKRFQIFFRLIASSLILLAFLTFYPARAQQAVVRAVLFYSPSCGHCHLVITETLLPMMEEYGDQLQIIGIDISTQQGSAIFGATLQAHGLQQGGVPFLLVGDRILVGSLDIPEQFPGLVEDYLAQGGVEWPDIPGLAEAIAQMEAEPAETPTTEPAIADTKAPEQTPSETSVPTDAKPIPEHTPTPATASLISTDGPASRQLSVTEKIALDPLGNGISIVVLVSMILVVMYLAVTFRRPAPVSLPSWQEWAVPVLSLLGLGVAGYLAYVETTHTTVVCGPVGDCNTVQQSEYAYLFGVLPIGVFGLVGYFAILVAWLLARFGSGNLKEKAWLAIFGMTLFGTLFSIYLTFLEPFVIGATCAWCLSSAVLITLLSWFSSTPARQGLAVLASTKTKSRKPKFSHNIPEG
jgi:uncharacterized membrane protein/thiol-disulfide isomerase/thioredoxin